MQYFISLTALLLALLASPLSAQEGDPERDSFEAAHTLRSYEQAIARLQASQGAYGTDLAEPLLGIGLALQEQGRHEEAIDFFKRGVHLTRINDGLYCARQIPLLEAEIASLIARADYEQADARQRYLYRVQLRSMDSGESLTEVYMQQADWQLQAYQLGLDSEDYLRLMNMWDLYRLALNDVMTREGETSTNLLPPLHGMLRAQYLIASYDWQTQRQSVSEDLGVRQDLYRFTAYQNESYSKGTSILEAMYSVQLEQEPSRQRSLSMARLLAILGDWHLYHRASEDAWKAYGAALAELETLQDAQTEIAALFGAPVAIPDIEGVRPLPQEVAADPGPGKVLIEFGVTDTGRAVDIERLDDNDALDGRAYRLMRTLRKTRFRPRFEAGQPVGTEHIVKAFDLQ